MGDTVLLKIAALKGYATVLPTPPIPNLKQTNAHGHMPTNES